MVALQNLPAPIVAGFAAAVKAVTTFCIVLLCSDVPAEDAGCPIGTEQYGALLLLARRYAHANLRRVPLFHMAILYWQTHSMGPCIVACKHIKGLQL